MQRLKETLKSKNVNARESGKVMKRLYLAMASRLRGAASHAFNLEKMLRGSMYVANVRLLRARLTVISPKEPVLKQILSSNDAQNRLGRFEEGFTRLRELRHKCSALGGVFDWDKLLDMIEDERKAEDTACSFCQATPPIGPVRFDPVRPGSETSTILGGKRALLTIPSVWPLLLLALLRESDRSSQPDWRSESGGFDSKQNCHIS